MCSSTRLPFISHWLRCTSRRERFSTMPDNWERLARTCAVSSSTTAATAARSESNALSAASDSPTRL